MTPVRSAESALQPGYRVKLMSEVNRAFSAADLLYFMDLGRSPKLAMRPRRWR